MLNGDFHIDDTLSSTPVPLPATCPKPVLLIESATPHWFAAGIPEE
jgi:hypothetical protein